MKRIPQHMIEGQLPVLDVVGFGAKVDGVTDDTPAWQAAIVMAFLLGGARIISSKVGVSIIAGALQDTSGANAQILLPAVDAVDSEQITIEIVGAVQPPTGFSVVGATPLPDNHLVLKSTLTAGSGGALLGGRGPVGTYENFTFVNLVLRNVAFRMPSNPTHSALDLRKVTNAEVDQVVIDVGTYQIQGVTEPTTTTSYGLRMPALNNGAHSVMGVVNVAGFYNGFEFNEHSNGLEVNSWGCKKAFVFTGAHHASKFQRMMAVHCERVLVFAGGTGSEPDDHYVDIDQLDIEHAASGWWVTDYDIDDASNYGHGKVKWHVVLAGVGVDSTFTVNGATNMHASRVGTESAGAAQVYVGRDRLVAAANDRQLTLGATPVANSPLIWVNNVIKWPTTDYTISGAVITFNAVLAASDVVLVKYETLTAAPGASTLTGLAFITDTFNRADNASSLGNTSVGNIPWTTLLGTLGINTNKARKAGGGAASHIAVVDSGTANGTVKVTVAARTAPDQPGLALRMATNGNGFIVESGTTSAKATLYKGVAGVYSVVAQSAGNLAFVAGDVIEAVMSGNSFTIKLNGATIIGPVSDATFNTVTKHGIYAFGSTANTDFDDFSVV